MSVFIIALAAMVIVIQLIILCIDYRTRYKNLIQDIRLIGVSAKCIESEIGHIRDKFEPVKKQLDEKRFFYDEFNDISDYVMESWVNARSLSVECDRISERRM
jgi:uncharacterized protein YoxC